LSIDGLQGLVLETYGSGNAPSAPWFINALKCAIDSGLTILNISQCKAGKVEMGKYEASVNLLNAGVISGEDMTTESAVTKLMILLGSITPKSKVEELMQISLCGEMSN
jgi:L-asparaginase